MFPLFVCGVNFLINFVAVSYASSRAIPFTTMLKISALGLFVAFPLTLIGTLLGRNLRGTASWPCRVNPVPRQIPEAQWCVRVCERGHARGPSSDLLTLCTPSIAGTWTL